MTVSRRITLVCAATVGALAVVAAVAVAQRAATHTTPGFTPVQLGHGVDAKVVGAAASGTTLDVVASQLEAKVNDPSIKSVAIRQQAETAAAAGGTQVVVTTSASSGPAASEASWKAELLAGALRDIAVAKGLTTVDNFEVDQLLPDGSAKPVDSGFGNVVPDEVFDTSSKATMRPRISAGLQSVDLSPISIDFAQGIQDAPVVIAKTTAPQKTIDASTDPTFWRQALGGDPLDYEGYFIEIVDASGNPVLISSAAHRAGSSSAWIQPDLQQPVRMNPVPTGKAGG